MKIKHRVSLDSKGIENIIESLHIYSLLPNNDKLVSFDLFESDQRWPIVAQLIQEKRGVDIYDTVFDKDEILSSAWSRIEPRFSQGYPQPETGWDELTYKERCPECGVGFTQQKPFYIKEMRIGKHDFVSLFWTKTKFCTCRTAEVIRLNNLEGLEFWDPSVFRTKEISKIVTQIVPQHIARPGLAESDKTNSAVCPRCGITKYAYHKRGYMHLSTGSTNPNVDIQFTHEWFGSGHSGFREILISNRFARLILENEWIGVQLTFPRD